MRETILMTAVLLAGLASAQGATSLEIGKYKLAGAYDLPRLVDEASGVAYNGDRNSLVVIDDGGTNFVEVSLTGTLLHAVAFTGYPAQGGVNTHDTEGVTYLGGNTYMMTSERNRNVYVFSAAFSQAVETVNISTQAKRIALFGADDDVGNSGLEGVSYDPLTGAFVGVKEKGDRDFYRFTYDPTTLEPSVTRPFSPSLISSWNLDDLADVQSLGGVPAHAGTALADNFLLISQASSRLIEIDGSGAVLGQLDLTGFSAGWNVEGVTMDFSGTIYIVGEKADQDGAARLFVLAPIPEPSTLALLAGALGMAGVALRGAGRTIRTVARESRGRP